MTERHAGSRGMAAGDARCFTATMILLCELLLGMMAPNTDDYNMITACTGSGSESGKDGEFLARSVLLASTPKKAADSRMTMDNDTK